MAKYIVANVADLKPGERMVVTLDERNVGVFNVDGEYFALLDQCPHAGAALCSFGTVFGKAEAVAPDATITYERGRSIRCPWHQWEFDIRTGESFYDPANARVRKYNVEVVEGCPEDVIDPKMEGIQKGPHILEGYHVSIEEDMVVVDTARMRRGTQSARARRVTSIPGITNGEGAPKIEAISEMSSTESSAR